METSLVPAVRQRRGPKRWAKVMALLWAGAGLSLAAAACGGVSPDAAGHGQPHAKGDLPKSGAHAPSVATSTSVPAATSTSVPAAPPTSSPSRIGASSGPPDTTTSTTAAASQDSGFQG